MEEEEEGSSHVNFVLMTRRGNKQQFSKLTVPVSAEFATKYKEREEVGLQFLYTRVTTIIQIFLHSFTLMTNSNNFYVAFTIEHKL